MPRIFLCALILVMIRAAGAADPVTITDLCAMRTIESIDVSADGGRAVVVVRSVGQMGDGERANQSHLFLADLRTTAPSFRQLTFGARMDSGAMISPSGDRIAFLRIDPAKGSTAQVWILPTDGGEAWVLTHLDRGVQSVRWAPDSERLLLTTREPAGAGAPTFPAERPGRTAVARATEASPRADGSLEELRAWLDANAERQTPQVIHRLQFQGERALQPEVGVLQLMVVRAESGAEPLRISRAWHDHLDANFHPDGRRVIYAAPAPLEVHPDRTLDRMLRILDLQSGEDAILAHQPGYALTQPMPSLDGSVIAFLGKATDEPSFRQQRLGVLSTSESGAQPVWLTDEESFETSVLSARWLPGRSSLIFSTARRGAFPLMTMGLGLLEPATLVDQIDNEPIGVHAFGAGGGTIVYAATTVSSPCVLHAQDARGDRLVADLNPWVRSREVVRPQAARVSRPDGVEVDCWLLPPARQVAGERYPLIVVIHGGPSGMYGPGELSTWHDFQTYCAWGFAVLYCNPRGSGGYGYAFQRLNRENWGEGPGGDVLAAVDHALLREWIDPERLYVTGGSYGGYLTAWLVASDTRFLAAVAERGVYDLETFYGEGNAWQLVEWAMGGPPWDARVRNTLRRESPINMVNRIRTPLLITHGSADLRTGVSQSEMLYRSLKVLGRDVEYVRYPGAGHELPRQGAPADRMDRLGRIIEFFSRFSSR